MTELQTSEVPNLPKGWTIALLGEIVAPMHEKFHPTKDSTEIFIGLEHIEGHTGKIIGFGKSVDVRSAKTNFHKGDILYGRLRPYLNKVCVPSINGVCSTDILVFKTYHMNNEYLARYLSTNEFVRYATQRMSGVQHPRISYEAMAKYEIPIPPLQEQHRIVSKLEELFTKLDSAIEGLKKAKVLLNRYRQSILKYAFEGTLTEKWRENHKKEIEHAFVSLEKIKEQRRTEKYSSKERLPTDITLPKEWVWTSVDQIAEKMQYGSSEKALDDEYGIPVLRMGNIRDKLILLFLPRLVLFHFSSKSRSRICGYGMSKRSSKTNLM